MENKSISELEGWKWKGVIPNRETHSGVECRFFELHNKPISKLDIYDIRFLIGQNSGLEYLVPYALKKLKEDVFLEVEYYPGDLLCSLFLINNEPNYWKSHTKEKQELIDLYTEQKKNLGSIDASDEIIQKIKEAYNEFLNK
jgi:hypothetical protein